MSDQNTRVYIGHIEAHPSQHGLWYVRMSVSERLYRTRRLCYGAVIVQRCARWKRSSGSISSGMERLRSPAPPPPSCAASVTLKYRSVAAIQPRMSRCSLIINHCMCAIMDFQKFGTPYYKHTQSLCTFLPAMLPSSVPMQSIAQCSAKSNIMSAGGGRREIVCRSDSGGARQCDNQTCCTQPFRCRC